MFLTFELLHLELSKQIVCISYFFTLLNHEKNYFFVFEPSPPPSPSLPLLPRCLDGQRIFTKTISNMADEREEDTTLSSLRSLVETLDYSEKSWIEAKHILEKLKKWAVVQNNR